MAHLTGDEFEAAYAARAGVTVEALHRHGRFAEPCDCGESICEGWQMSHAMEDAIVENELRADNPCRTGHAFPSGSLAYLQAKGTAETCPRCATVRTRDERGRVYYTMGAS